LNGAGRSTPESFDAEKPAKEPMKTTGRSIPFIWRRLGVCHPRSERRTYHEAPRWRLRHKLLISPVMNLRIEKHTGSMAEALAWIANRKLMELVPSRCIAGFGMPDGRD